MICVFLKELKQFRHSQTLIIMFFLTAMLSAAAVVLNYAPQKVEFIPLIMSAIAHLLAVIFQLSAIAAAGSRWKNENGDGSIDIVRTTPISPLSVSLAKISAAVLVAYPAFLLSAIASTIIFKKSPPIADLLTTGFLQTLALTALSLGCATFQNRKRGSFDFAMVAVILAMLPVISIIFKGFTQGLSTDDFIAANAGLLAAAALGMSLCVCGASPKNSDRAMTLKITVAAIAVILPFIYKHTTMQTTSLRDIMANSLFFAAVFIIAGALFERLKQTRRVLASPLSRRLFIFGTGVGNSFLLFIITGAASLIISEDSNFSSCSIFAKILFYSGICQFSRNPRNSKFPVIACLIIVLLIPASAISRFYLPESCKWIPDLFMFNKNCPLWATAVFAIAGAILYTPALLTFFKQYFQKGNMND